MDWDEILSLDENDPNISINNFHQHINFLLDGCATDKKLSKSEFKLLSKHTEIHSKRKKEDVLLHNYCKTADKGIIASQTIYEEYKISEIN